MSKLYYCEEEGNFYQVKQTPKTIIIDWDARTLSDGSELDQNVRWKHLKARKIQTHTNGHPIKQNDENGILLYPFQDGQPFFLEPLTKEHIEKEIESCKKWGVSSEYYENLKPYV